MATRISEEFKIVPGLYPIELATTNKTGKYIRAGRRNTVICQVGAVGTVAGNETAVFQVWKATDNIGTGAAIFTGVTDTYTAAQYAHELNILHNACANGKYFTLHGNTYKKAGAYSLANKEFSSTDELVTLMNAVDADIYVSKTDATNVNVVARNFGSVDLTASGIAGWEAAKLFPTTLSGIVIIEFKDSDLGVTGTTPYTHFSLKCTTNMTELVSGVILIDNGADNKPVDNHCVSYKS